MDPSDFECIPDRLAGDSLMWRKYGGRDVLPLWIASMHWKSPKCVLDALHRRVEEGVFDYAMPSASAVESVIDFYEKTYRWKIDPAWVVWVGGGVAGLSACARMLGKAGDEFLTLGPIYPPILQAPVHNGRRIRAVALRLTNRQVVIDWDALQAAVTPQSVGFILCSPHNPLGRVWRADELTRLVQFCNRNNLVLISDEVHAGLVLDESLAHVPVGSLGAEAAATSITLAGPSKTYNLQLSCSFAIIPEENLRQRFIAEAEYKIGLVTAFGYAATEAAYRHAEPWRQDVLSYLRANRDLLIGSVDAELLGVSIEAPIEATYLAWLNVAAIQLADPASHFEKHGVGLLDGAAFGAEPGHYLRMNFAVPRATLKQAIDRMAVAIRDLG